VHVRHGGQRPSTAGLISERASEQRPRSRSLRTRPTSGIQQIRRCRTANHDAGALVTRDSGNLVCCSDEHLVAAGGVPPFARKPGGCVSLTGASDACGSSASVVHASARDACLAFRPARSATSSPWGHSWVQTWPNRARSGLSRAAPRAFDSPDLQARRRELRSRRVASHARGRWFETSRAHGLEASASAGVSSLEGSAGSGALALGSGEPVPVSARSTPFTSALRSSLAPSSRRIAWA
jgi:hypothetical protein